MSYVRIVSVFRSSTPSHKLSNRFRLNFVLVSECSLRKDKKLEEGFTEVLELLHWKQPEKAEKSIYTPVSMAVGAADRNK